MLGQDLCEKCSDNQSCKGLYRQLGQFKGPSVAAKAMSAFLLPIVILICSLGFFEYLLSGAIQAEGLRTALSLFAAVLMTAGYIYLIKVFRTERSAKLSRSLRGTK